VKHPYRLILVDKDGVLVSEFQLTENDLANPEAFVDTLKRSIEQVEEEELWVEQTRSAWNGGQPAAALQFSK
jgi:hypothetical protein